MEELLRLVEQHGLKLIERAGDTHGGFEPHSATIRITPGMSSRTTCSVVAHELGHALLGHVPTTDATTRARQERRADEWAARQLITPDAYAQAEQTRGAHPTSLAFELGVTVELVIAYQRLLRRHGSSTYLDPRLGRGQWAHRQTG